MNQPSKPNAAPAVSLKQLMNVLVSNSLAAAVHNKSSVLNEVASEITIDGSNQKLIRLITELLDAVVTNSRNGEIHISADRYRDVVVLSIQERNNYNGYALSYSVSSIEREAFAVGGHISIRGPQQKVATVSFSFPVPAAA